MGRGCVLEDCRCSWLLFCVSISEKMEDEVKIRRENVR